MQKDEIRDLAGVVHGSRGMRKGKREPLSGHF